MLGQSMKIEHTLSPCAILRNSFPRTLMDAKVMTKVTKVQCTGDDPQCAQCEQEEGGGEQQVRRIDNKVQCTNDDPQCNIAMCTM